MLATYNLCPVSHQSNPYESEKVTHYFGIAVSPGLKRGKCSHVGEDMYYSYRAVPCSLPIDEKKGCLQMAAFLQDSGVLVKEDPLYEVIWGVREGLAEDQDKNGDVKKSLEKRLKERQDEFPPQIPRWMEVEYCDAWWSK